MAEITLKFEQICDALGAKYFSARFARVHFLLLCLGLFAIFLGFPEADPDLFARVAMGRLIEIHRNIPLVDPFAYTAKNPIWFDHEWLSGLVFYWLSQNGGDLSLFLFKTIIAFLTLFFLIKSLSENISEVGLESLTTPRSINDKTNQLWSPLTILWLLICSLPLSAIWNSNVRSHIFTFLFLAIFFWAIRDLRDNQSKIPLYFLPALMAIWANAHGGFVLGLIFLATSILSEKNRLPIFICLLACLGATLINPYGLDYWWYIFAALSMHRPLITEWMPTNLILPENWLFVAIASILIAPIAKSPKTILTQPGNLFLLICLYASIKHNRFVPLFAISAFTFGFFSFLRFLNFLSRKSPKYFSMVRRSFIALVSVYIFYSIFALGSFLVHLESFSLRYDEYPSRAFAWLRANYSNGNVLVDFNNGSFALWRLYPKFKISLDGRFEEVYPMSTYWDVMDAYNLNSPKQKAAFERLNPDFILLPNTTDWTVWQDRFGSSWRLAYKDDSFLILSQQTASNNKISEVPIWRPLF